MKLSKALLLGLLLTAPGWGDITSVGTFAAGSNGQVQYNDRNDFGASSDLVYSTTTKILTAPAAAFSTITLNGQTYRFPTNQPAGYYLSPCGANVLCWIPPVSPVGGGGASSLGVNWNGVPVTTPTLAINVVSPLIVTSVGAGATAQISVDVSSFTLNGPLSASAPINLSGGAFSLDKSSVTLRGPDPALGGALSGTISNAVLGIVDISAKTNLAANPPLVLVGDTITIDKSSVTLLGPAIDSGELPADGYASTYVNTSGDTMTGQLTVTGSSVTATGSGGIRATYGISGGSLTARNLASTLVAVDASGVLISTTVTIPAAGVAMLGISSGSATNSVVVSSPTSNVVVDSNTFILSLQGSTSAFIQVKGSSVTLHGENVILLQSTPQGASSVFNVSSGTANNLNVTTMTVAQDLTVGDDATITGGLTVNGGSGITISALTANRCVETNGSGRLTSTSGDCSNSQVAILSTGTLQSGATFYVSSGTVNDQLSVGTLKFSLDGSLMTSADQWAPGGSEGSVQFKNGGIHGGTSDFLYDTTSKFLSVKGVATSTITVSSATVAGILRTGATVIPSGGTLTLWDGANTNPVSFQSLANQQLTITAGNGIGINTTPNVGSDLSIGSIRWPDGTIQVSSPPVVVPTVLTSSGIAFGSASNTVTSDTNTIAWDNINKTLFLGSPVASIGTFKPRLSLYGDGSITDYWVGNYMTDTSSAVSHYYLFGKFGDGTGGAGNQDMSFDICQEGYDFPKCGDASSAYGDIVFANSIGPFGNSNFIFLAGSAAPMKLGNNGAFFAAGLNASSETFTNLTASRFVQTNANKNLVSYDLLNATQTWTGGNAFSSVTVQNITINGTCTGSGCGAGGGGAGVIAGIGNLYDIPYVSVASSNTLSMSGNVKVFPSSVTIMGTVPILSTSTLQSATTIYVASGTVATAFITNGSVVHKTPISINQPETGMVNSAINFSQQGTTSGSIQQLYYGGTGFNSSLLLRSPSDASFTHYTNAYIDPDYGFSVITGSNSPRSLSAGTTLGGPYDFSVSTQGYTSVSSIHWPDGTIQVSSPPVVVPTVLTSSGIAFGSVTNTVTSDTNTLTWNNTTKTLSASNAVFPTQMGVGSGSNLYTETLEYQTLNFNALINNSFAFNVNSSPVLTISGTQAFFGGYTSLNEIAAPGGASGQATLWGDSTAHWLKMINNAGATYGIIGSSTTNVGGHFPMWSGAYGLKDYDLLNATQTWTGQQAWTSGQRSTFTVSPALLNVTNGLLATNSVGVIVSTTVDLAAGNVGGNLPVSRLNGGSGATSSTFWRGDGTWVSSSTFGSGTGSGVSTYTAVVLRDSDNVVWGVTISTNGNLTSSTTLPTSSVAFAYDIFTSTNNWYGGNAFNSTTTFNGVITSTAIYVSSATIGMDEYSNGTYSAISTITWQNGNFQKVTLTANTAFNFIAPAHPATLTLRILTGAGSFACTWPGTVKWSGGTAPTITVTASRADFVVCKYASDGNYYCSAAGVQNFTP